MRQAKQPNLLLNSQSKRTAVSRAELALRPERPSDYLRDAADNAVVASRVLMDLLNHHKNAGGRSRRLVGLEYEGYSIPPRRYAGPQSTIVIILTDEDVQSLAHAIDTFATLIREVAHLLQPNRVEEPTPSARLLGRIIAEQAILLSRAISKLEQEQEYGEILGQVIELRRLEKMANDTLNQTMVVLYDGASDVSTLTEAIRLSELYHLMENATDRAGDIASVLEGMILQHM